MIDVIMPVYGQEYYTKRILDCISRCEYQPREIFVIDGADSDEVADLIKDYPVRATHVRLPHNIGVNAAWNLGIALAKADHLAFLNNDLLIPDFFFSEMHRFMKAYPEAGFVIPLTISSEDAVFLTKRAEQPRFQRAFRREGWCFLMPASLAKQIGYVPASLHTFYGDDWFYKGVLEKGRIHYRLLDVPIYHYGSKTLQATGLQKNYNPERAAWNDLKS